MSARRALVCNYNAPEPDRDCGSGRVLHLIEFLRDDGWAVDFFALNGTLDPRYARGLRRRGVATYDHSCGTLDDLALSGRYELALFAFWQTAERYLTLLREVSPSTCIVVDSIDLQFVRDARFALRAPRHGLLTDEYARELVGELNTYTAADAVLTVSQREAKLVNDLAADRELASAVPLVDDSQLSRVPFAKRTGIAFVGNFTHTPNARAAEYLCGEILPRLPEELRVRHPVWLIGVGSDQWAGRLDADVRHVRALGWVPSLLPYLSTSRISVVPLVDGAGTKGKLLQTLMVGTPAVSTSIGAEGFDLRPGEDVLVADEPEVFADSMRALLTDGRLWRRVVSNGRKAAEARHGREPVRTAFLTAIERALARPRKPSLLRSSSEQQYERRMVYLDNQKMMTGVRTLVKAHLPDSAVVAVVDNGSRELLRLEGPEAWPFPMDENGSHAEPPSSGEAAVARLEAIRAEGADYLLVPRTAFPWLDRFPELGEHLRARYSLVVGDDDACHLFALRDASEGRQVRVQAERSQPVDLNRAMAPTSRSNANEDVKLIAFYLPQFHPIPENDRWWGEGFTEWRNVARATPLFPGHYQPHVPADLGFYDLRLPETRLAQAELAASYGIGGFCYYHYWFNGTRLLPRPFDEVLASGEPALPFCLCWANEPWSRRWDGRETDVLQPQSFSPQDDIAHIRWLIPALEDPRALRIDGKPIFIVYQARDLPYPAWTVETWREEAEKAGLPGLYLTTVETGWDEGWDACEIGFDAKVMFRPQFTILRSAPRLEVGSDELQVHDYQRVWPILAAPENVSYPRYETVCPGWDNTPRVGERGVVLHNSTPEAYEEWLAQAIERARQRPAGQRIVFVNAWNEWAEGCHLEPDLRHGRAYLEATERAIRRQVEAQWSPTPAEPAPHATAPTRA